MSVGIDIVNIEEFEKSMAQKGFCERIFTEGEIAYCNGRPSPNQHYAARFAAKEAVIKALDRKIPLQNIEIINSKSGKPSIILIGSQEDNIICSVSLSHTKELAAAVAICE